MVVVVKDLSRFLSNATTTHNHYKQSPHAFDLEKHLSSQKEQKALHSVSINTRYVLNSTVKQSNDSARLRVDALFFVNVLALFALFNLILNLRFTY